jgi:ribosome production factor 1
MVGGKSKSSKQPHKSLLGKKPAHKAKLPTSKTTQPLRNPGRISNRLKRSEMYGKYLTQKRQQQQKFRQQRVQKETEALGQDLAVTKQTPRTIDNTREVEPTLVTPDDVEVRQDEQNDEFAPYFEHGEIPRVLVTTRPRPSANVFHFIADLQKLIPGLHYYPRKSFSVKEICHFASNRNFTHLIILSEKSKQTNGMTISHLGRPRRRPSTNTDKTDSDDEDSEKEEESGQDNGDDEDDDDDEEVLIGPTAFFKVSSVVTSRDIPNHGASTSHVPELNLHGFGTRLGHRVGRLLGSLFPVQSPEFRGRQVVTFHNQRDCIFVRQHRYVFRETTKTDNASALAKKPKVPPPLDTTTAPTRPDTDIPVKAKLQELGPRFTLKLRWLQEGTFDTQFGEYEFFHKRKEMDTSRRKFHL